MQVDFDRVGRFRRRLAVARRGAWILLALSIAGVAVWERLGGPQPDDFGYRFSPMYTFSPTGMVFWSLIGGVLVAVALINYLYLGINLKLRCPSCAAVIPAKAEWECGHCSGVNRPLYGGIKDSYYVLLTECKHCHRVPPGYRCAGCGTVSAFDGGRAPDAAARAPAVPDRTASL